MDNCRYFYQKRCDSVNGVVRHQRGKENTVAGVKWSVLVTKTLFPEDLCSKPTAPTACSGEILLSDKIMDQDCIVSYRPWLYSGNAIQRTKWLHKKEKSV